MMPGFTHPAFFIIYLLILFVVFLSKYFSENNWNIKSFFVKGIQVGLLIILLNSVWFLPRIFTLSDELQFASSVGLSESLIKNSSSLNFVNVISGVGFSSLKETVTWYDWQNYFESEIMIFFGIIILIIIFAPPLFV